MSYEENMQKVIDLRARVLDVNQADPSPEEVWEAVNALHSTRGVAAKTRTAKNVQPIDLNALFAPAPEKKDGEAGA